MNWFERLTGFSEESPEQVRENIALKHDQLTSLVNGNELFCGVLEIPQLQSLRSHVQSCATESGATTVREVIADVQELHADRQNAGAVFQVASQFNLLEMVSPSVTPEYGVAIYESDRTQGPACAIAAGAGTIYRNYFVPVGDQIGQSANHQINCLADLGAELGNQGGRLWEMRNGYALATKSGLAEVSERIEAADDRELQRLRGLLRIGIQSNTQVTLAGANHFVTQAYCSAMPVAYSRHCASQWAAFAKLILQAAYEATFCAAILNGKATGNRTLFLTLLGGGAFGNETAWIIEAIRRSLDRYKDFGLDVAIVSYGRSKTSVRELVAGFEAGTGSGLPNAE